MNEKKEQRYFENFLRDTRESLKNSLYGNPPEIKEFNSKMKKIIDNI